MRRREKFVIAAILLSAGLLGVTYTPLEFRYWVVAAFAIVSYLVASWALSDDLKWHERFTIVPFPALYALSVGLFYFLLPANFLTQGIILAVFGIGMYALFLTANIFSVAKGRTIQLLHAAHAVGLLFNLLTSLLFANTIFSLKLPFYANSALIGLSHFPLVMMSLWSVRLEERVSREILGLSVLLTLILMETGLVLSFFPISIWNSALFVMSLLYIGLGVLHSYLKERLFSRTIREYTLVAIFVAIVFFILFPTK